MSTPADPIQNFATAVQANIAATATALTNLAAGIANLDALIVQFQNSPGTLSAADQASLDSIQAASAALLSQAQAISTAAPGQTPPVVPVPPATT